MKKGKVNLKVIKKTTKVPCYCCNEGLYGKAVPRKNCKACNGTGKFLETMYYHIITDKQGNKICFDGDTIK